MRGCQRHGMSPPSIQNVSPWAGSGPCADTSLPSVVGALSQKQQEGLFQVSLFKNINTFPLL